MPLSMSRAPRMFIGLYKGTDAVRLVYDQERVEAQILPKWGLLSNFWCIHMMKYS